jgi:hypothetical protein
MRRKDMPLLPQEYLPQWEGKIFARQSLFIGMLGLIFTLLSRSQQGMVAAPEPSLQFTPGAMHLTRG